MTAEKITINGGRPLMGRIELKGAKNLVTKAMVAALLGDGPSELRDVPDISDVRVVRGLLEIHGVKVSDGADEGVLVLDPSNVESPHGGHRRARRFQSHSDPVLRPVAAPAR